LITEDYQAWIEYPQYRWIYNKLELSIKLGYDAGPACVPITKTGNYIIRPIYNLYGMGIGSHIRKIDISEAKLMENHALIPPGYFWCEYFEGDHISIDFKRTKSPSGSIFAWKIFHAMQGIENKKELTKFEKWIRIELTDILLPDFLNEIDCPYLNIEMIGNKIIEVHLRKGNQVLYGQKIGASVTPLWRGQEHYINSDRYIENEDPTVMYNASGYIGDVRIGYLRNED
jgi:hypothetical protein